VRFQLGYVYGLHDYIMCPFSPHVNIAGGFP
jgi:hypothetical protein